MVWWQKGVVKKNVIFVNKSASYAKLEHLTSFSTQIWSLIKLQICELYVECWTWWNLKYLCQKLMRLRLHQTQIQTRFVFEFENLKLNETQICRNFSSVKHNCKQTENTWMKFTEIWQLSLWCSNGTFWKCDGNLISWKIDFIFPLSEPLCTPKGGRISF